MTTTPTKLNTKQLLFQLANSQSSGCLWFDSELVSWKIYLQQGSLKYVYCSAQLLDQLKYYLHYLGFRQAVAALKQLPSSNIDFNFPASKTSSYQNLYGEVIFWLREKQHLTPSQSLQLIRHITKDALNACLWSDGGTSSWHEGHFLPLWIIDDLPSLSISECLKEEENRLTQWRKCSKKLVSIHQRPYFTSGWEHYSLPTSGTLKRQNLRELTQVIRGNISISQLALFLGKDELHVAQILSPYIDKGIIKLKNSQSPLNRLPGIPPTIREVRHLSTDVDNKQENSALTAVSTWKIVCIDDSPTILKEIQRFLDTDRFEITAVDDPVQAVPIIFRIKPDLILLDITMPRINGYKLCGLLRGSESCSQTPIIMVTGNTGLIDKARAKIAGATDYLTKPFTQERLTQIVTKHLQ